MSIEIYQNDYRALYTFFNSIVDTNRVLFNHIIPFIHKGQYNRGETILSYGDIETRSNFVLKGVVHQFIYDEWNVHLKNYCTYNYSINDVDIILPWENSSFLPSLFHHQITGEMVHTYNFEELLYVPLLDQSYFYSSKDPNTSSENTKEADGIKVFPNPADDFVVVESPGNVSHVVFEIFDLTSSQVMSARIMGRRTIDLSNLTKGIYLYQTKENGNISTGKLMVW